MLLKDKVVVITGSTKGIGKGIALKVLEEGGIPVISGIEKDLLEEVLPKEYAAMGHKDLLFVEIDVTNFESLQNLMKVTYDKYGRIDCLCANAGITDVCILDDLDPERFTHMVDVNLKGEFLAIKAAIPYLRKNKLDGEIRGKIVCTGSDCSLTGWQHLTSYSAAKFGVRGMVQALARELGPERITVNCVCPGIIETDMWKKHDKLAGAIENLKPGEAWQNEVKKIPLGRGGTPADIGNGVVMLLSHYADYITGCSLPVGGGSSIH